MICVFFFFVFSMLYFVLPERKMFFWCFSQSSNYLIRISGWEKHVIVANFVEKWCRDTIMCSVKRVTEEGEDPPSLFPNKIIFSSIGRTSRSCEIELSTSSGQYSTSWSKGTVLSGTNVLVNWFCDRPSFSVRSTGQETLPAFDVQRILVKLV